MRHLEDDSCVDVDFLPYTERCQHATDSISTLEAMDRSLCPMLDDGFRRVDEGPVQVDEEAVENGLLSLIFSSFMFAHLVYCV